MLARIRARIDLLVVGLVVAAAAIALPFLLPGFQTLEVSYALVFAIAILGLNVLTGYTGQITLGHGAFIAIGAYASAIVQTKLGINYLASIPIAAAVCGALGFGVGIPALRLEGIYLALATFALAVAAPTILKSHALEPLTGGVKGIILPPVTSTTDLLTDDQFFYMICLAITAVLFFLAWNILRGRTGRAFRAIRDGDLAAVSFGINLASYKTLAFALSAALAGVAGALYGIATGFVSADAYPFQLSIGLLVGAVLGGLGTLEGAVIGGFFVVFLPILAQQALGAINKQVANAAPTVTQGILLLVVMLVARQGVAGLVRTAYFRARLRLGGGGAKAALAAQEAKQAGPL
ncbi:MAG: branched-chain amino acid ABC transporter permease [Candidatus Dormibacteria bacterium]